MGRDQIGSFSSWGTSSSRARLERAEPTEPLLGSTPPRFLGCVKWNTFQRHTLSLSLTTGALDIVIPLVDLTRWFHIMDLERDLLTARQDGGDVSRCCRPAGLCRVDE
jgi:hypothetical protein